MALSRESSEYKAALEIELWKDIKNEEFLINLQKKEKQLLAELADNVRQDQEQMEVEVRASKKACDLAVRQYKEILAKLEKRESKFGQNGIAFERTLESFNKERQAKLDDVKQKSSYKGDFLALELETLATKIKYAESQNIKLVSRLDHAEKSLQLKDLAIQKVPSSCDTMIPTKLQDELFETKLDFTRRKEEHSKLIVSKERYKLKLKSVLGELSSANQSWSALTQYGTPIPSSALNQINVKPTMPSRHATKNIIVAPVKDSEFDRLKCELDGIVEKMKRGPVDRQVSGSVDVESDIAKLISERNTLLNTGVYLSNDFIIQQIDNKIKKLLDFKVEMY